MHTVAWQQIAHMQANKVKAKQDGSHGRDLCHSASDAISGVTLPQTARSRVSQAKETQKVRKETRGKKVKEKEAKAKEESFRWK